MLLVGWIIFAWAIWEVMKTSLNLVRGTIPGTLPASFPGFSKKQEVFVA